MRSTRFPALAALLTGAAAPAAPVAASENDDNTLDVGAVEAAMAAEVDKATKDATAAATKAANDRWNAVLSTDEGAANAAAAAHLLATTTQSAEDVLATIAKFGVGASSSQKGGNAGVDKQRLANANDARPDTGGAQPPAKEERSGGARRSSTAEARNQQTIAAAGGADRVRGGAASNR